MQNNVHTQHNRSMAISSHIRPIYVLCIRRLFMFTLSWFQANLNYMTSRSTPSSSKDAQDLPEWAEWPLKPNGKLDVQRLMPTTYRVCSKEYSLSRQELAKSLPILIPKRGRADTKDFPFINNLTLLEFFDLAGEEILEFRSYILESLGEYDRIDNGEKLLTDHASIKRSMEELRRVANEIHGKKSRDDSNYFLQKRANLAILGYFTRQDPRNLSPPAVSPRQFKEFLNGNRGCARASVYNWRYKKWEESIVKNLSYKEDSVMIANRKFIPVRRAPKKEETKEKLPLEDMPILEVQSSKDTSMKSTIPKVPPVRARTVLHATRPPSVLLTSSPLKSPTVLHPLSSSRPATVSKMVSSGCTPSTSRVISTAVAQKESPSDEKMEMEEGFNVENAALKGRDEVNFYCAVKANKVNPSGFGMPKGFIKFGDKIIHRTKSDKLDITGKRRRRSPKKRETPKKVRCWEKEKCVKIDNAITIKKEGEAKREIHDDPFDSDGSQDVVMDDIEDDDSDSQPEVDVCGGKGTIFTENAETQTQEDEFIVRSEKGDTVVDAETVEQLSVLESVHVEDISTIRNLRLENATAVRNLSKYHNKFVALMIDRNNLKCTLNVIDKERKTERMEMIRMNKHIKSLSQTNSTLLDEVNSLKREISARDQLDANRVQVARFEES